MTISSHVTIRQGSTGADVKAWQAVLGVPQDGNFNASVVSATKSWQSAHGLTADGVVGPQTWSAAVMAEGAKGGLSIINKVKGIHLPLWGKVAGAIVLLGGVFFGVRKIRER